MRERRFLLWLLIAVTGSACGVSSSEERAVPGKPAWLSSSPASQSPRAEDPVPVGIYADTTSGELAQALRAVPLRVYVPDGRSNAVTVIDPQTFKVIATYRIGDTPQHVVPSYDLRRLWVLANHASTVTEIDPMSGAPIGSRPVPDPYNLYFTLDGTSAVVVAEARQRLDFRDPATMALTGSMPLDCKGANHLDFSGDGRYAVVACEFDAKLVKIDITGRQVVGALSLAPGAMPQDVRVTGDGRTFYVADLVAGGVHIIDGDAFRATGFVPTGLGAHGLVPSRDAQSFYVTNRGERGLQGQRRQPGSISVIDTRTTMVTATWPIPGGGSPDMGNLSPDGTQLWVSGRYDDEVYALDTRTGALLARIPVGSGPHGLTVWPQPGRLSLGHTGNMR